MRSSSLAKVAAVAAVSALVLSACSNSTPAATTSAGPSAGPSASSGGSSSNTTYKIGYQGPLSGDNQQLGINMVNAVELAVEQANAAGDLGFKLELVKSDDVGSADKAPAAAATLIQDTAVVGVVGPAFSGPTKATGATYTEAKIALISPSATNATLTTSGWTSFHRIVPPDSVEGQQAADWMAKKAKTAYVIDDLTDYGKGVSDDVQKELESKGVKVTREGVDKVTTDYSAISQTIASSKVDALFYGGYDAAASLFAQALKSAGYAGVTVTGNGGKSSVFTSGAGEAGNGWYFSCGCLDATVAPAAQAFEKAYETKFSTPSSTYSPEAYDAANAMISVLKGLAAKGEITRADVLAGVDKLDYKGITTQIKFTATGEVEQQVINLYQQKAGKIGLLGIMADQS